VPRGKDMFGGGKKKFPAWLAATPGSNALFE
jgi:hypothetical protein